MARDYYGLLGVPKGASADEIKKAYRVTIRRLHQEGAPGMRTDWMLRRVNDAYAVLSDPKKRELLGLGGDPLGPLTSDEKIQWAAPEKLQRATPEDDDKQVCSAICDVASQLLRERSIQEFVNRNFGEWTAIDELADMKELVLAARVREPLAGADVDLLAAAVMSEMTCQQIAAGNLTVKERATYRTFSSQLIQERADKAARVLAEFQNNGVRPAPRGHRGSAQNAPAVELKRAVQVDDALGINKALRDLAGRLLKDGTVRSFVNQNLDADGAPDRLSSFKEYRRAVADETFFAGTHARVLQYALFNEMAAQQIENGALTIAERAKFESIQSEWFRDFADSSLDTLHLQRAGELALQGNEVAREQIFKPLEDARLAAREAAVKVAPGLLQVADALGGKKTDVYFDPVHYATAAFKALELLDVRISPRAMDVLVDLSAATKPLAEKTDLLTTQISLMYREFSLERYYAARQTAAELPDLATTVDDLLTDYSSKLESRAAEKSASCPAEQRVRDVVKIVRDGFIFPLRNTSVPLYDVADKIRKSSGYGAMNDLSVNGVLLKLDAFMRTINGPLADLLSKASAGFVEEQRPQAEKLILAAVTASELRRGGEPIFSTEQALTAAFDGYQRLTFLKMSPDEPDAFDLSPLPGASPESVAKSPETTFAL